MKAGQVSQARGQLGTWRQQLSGRPAAALLRGGIAAREKEFSSTLSLGTNEHRALHI